MIIYLDNAATTRVDPDVAQVLGECLEIDYGNPSSAHRMGIAAGHRLRSAREALLRAIGDEQGKLGDVIWTSGGTEADALAVLGSARPLAKRGRHVVATAIEHPAVLGAMMQLESEGFTQTIVPVTKDGVVAQEAVKAAMHDGTVLVSCMLVNNELGTVQPVADIARSAKYRGALVHCDAVQALGKLPIDVASLGVDLLSVSAHKIHGPKGVGALWVRRGVKLLPLWSGGGQERGLRSGTENVPGIAAMGEAALLATRALSADSLRIGELRALLESRVKDGMNAQVNGSAVKRVPHISSIAIRNVPAEPLLHALEARGVYVSAGAACSSHGLSHVLLALGLPNDMGTLRLSLSRFTSAADIEIAATALIEEARALRGQK